MLAQLDYSYEDYVQMYEVQYGQPFTPYDFSTVQFLRQETIGYMLPPRSPMHEVAIAVNSLRDLLLADGLKKLWDAGISAFVPFGVSHGLTLKNYIETLGFDIEDALQEQTQHANAYDIPKRRIQDFAGMHSPVPGIIQPYPESPRASFLQSLV